MPTTFYFSNDRIPPPELSPAYSTITGSALNTCWSGIQGAARWMMNTEKGGSPLFNGPMITSPGTTANYRQLWRQYISPPLNGAQTVSGPFSGFLQVAESATNDNIDRLMMCLKVVTSSGTNPRTGVGVSGWWSTFEFSASTTYTSRCFASGSQRNLTSISANDGDRIVVEIGFGLSAGGASVAGNARWGELGPDISGVGESHLAPAAGWLTLPDVNLVFKKNLTTIAVV